MSLQKIALIGKGFLGSAVLQALLNANFTVTVLTRSVASLSATPADVSVKEVDYTSLDSLQATLHGHDTVVCTIKAHFIPLQKTMIDASILAGVKRFIPADFGALSADPAAHTLPNQLPALELQAYLKEKANEGKLDWTIFSVGPFMDFVFSKGFIVDFEKHDAVLYDQGEHAFSTTSVEGIGKAVAGALRKPEETRNRVLHVHECVLTQRKLLDIAKRRAGPEVEWAESSVDAKGELRDALDKAATGIDLPVVIALLRAGVMGGMYEAEYKHVDNELVGLPVLSDAEFEAKFAAAVY